MQLGQPSVDWTMRCPARVKFSSTTADEDETSEGNPGNSNGDAVDVVPPVGMAEPGPLAISSENGNRRIFSEKHYLHINQSCWLFGGHP